MKRLPIILSATALAVSVLGATPLGRAAGRALTSVPPFAKRAGYATTARNALALSGHKASTSGSPGTVPVVDSQGRLPGETVSAPGLLDPPHLVMRAETLPAFQRSSMSVDCPVDYPLVLGGGAREASAGGSAALVVNGTAPGDNSQGWVADVSNQGDTDLTVDVYAICAKEQPQ